MNYKTLLPFIIILFFNYSFGQIISDPLDYYPLQVGNKWIYKEVPYNAFENDTGDTYRYRYEEIVGDTILGDGLHYFIKKFWYTNQVIHTAYQRIDSIAKIIYNEWGYDEYNLSARPDSIWIDNYGMENMLRYDTALVGELNIVRPIIIYQQGYFYFNRTLAKGIGFCFAEYGDLGGHTLDFLVYAKINGEEYGSTVDVPETEIIGINDFILYQNYPNPFNPTTMIKFSVKKSGSVKLLVYDIQGQLIKAILNENKNPGTYTVEFNGSKLSSGFYYYEIESGHSRKVKKMLLLK